MKKREKRQKNWVEKYRVDRTINVKRNIWKGTRKMWEKRNLWEILRPVFANGDEKLDINKEKISIKKRRDIPQLRQKHR